MRTGPAFCSSIVTEGTNLLLARHGNTFGPGDPVVWVGRAEDLPLVAKGRDQAHALATALRRSGWLPEAVYCGPLRRTRQHAEIVTEELGLAAPVVDERLQELDYGDWAGRTSEEIEADGAADELKRWQEACRWPANAGWAGTEDGVRAEVRGFAEDVAAAHRGGTVLAVSSNGRLRYFLGLVEGELQRRIQSRAFSVRTGHICVLSREASGWRVQTWNLEPTELPVYRR